MEGEKHGNVHISFRKRLLHININFVKRLDEIVPHDHFLTGISRT